MTKYGVLFVDEDGNHSIFIANTVEEAKKEGKPENIKLTFEINPIEGDEDWLLLLYEA